MTNITQSKWKLFKLNVSNFHKISLIKTRNYELVRDLENHPEDKMKFKRDVEDGRTL